MLFLVLAVLRPGHYPRDGDEEIDEIEEIKEICGWLFVLAAPIHYHVVVAAGAVVLVVLLTLFLLWLFFFAIPKLILDEPDARCAARKNNRRLLK